MSIETFLTNLAKTKTPPHVFNPYDHENTENNMRRTNLTYYLQTLRTKQPSTLLVGEAPGYRGCRLTGIPFTSPNLLQSDMASQQLFGENQGYLTPNEWPHIQREASATIVWQLLNTLPNLPLLWNAFPFHPHKPGNRQSNRPPKRSELALGRPFLTQLLHLFPITDIIAVGNKADTALTMWQIPHEKVRHPSHGGKQQFVNGIIQLLK
ncbi:MAG: uracil-DNA glycosylase [Chloroflexi bacterium]|nr:MAG: uracil-DNA glycosylase [Chloroflexota bacterium]